MVRGGADAAPRTPRGSADGGEDGTMADIFSADRVRLGGSAATRDEAIREAGAMLVAAGAVDQAYVDAMFDRERTVSTYMGNLLAIPHGTNEAKDAIRASALAAVRYDHELDWDGNPVRFVIAIAGKDGEHLGILAGVAVAFSDDEQVERMLAATTPEELIGILAEGAEA